MKKPFIDRVKINVRSGRGGNGCVSFRREKFVPRGGPDGGKGGKGGDVILVARTQVLTLLDFYYHPLLKAGDGAHGQGKKKAGKEGRDLVMEVPCGTVIKDLESGRVLSDLVEDGQKFILGRGGRGGRGNASFATSTRRSPRIAEKGEEGEAKSFLLELKLIADIGMVGFPNAGKSTLISRLSRARPRIAPYPFTTLNPVLGIMEGDGFGRLSIADIPGLIEGSHKNAGLGHDFLRHIERTGMLLFVLDMGAVEGRSPVSDFQILRRELELHDPRLLKIPFLVAANKMDLPPAAVNLKKFSQEVCLPPGCVYPVSALKGGGLKELKMALFRLLAGTGGKERNPEKTE